MNEIYIVEWNDKVMLHEIYIEGPEGQCCTVFGNTIEAVVKAAQTIWRNWNLP